MQDWFDESLEKVRITAKKRPSFITVRKFTDEKS
jgi:hypothetical protein